MRADWEREYAEYAGVCLVRLRTVAYALSGDVHRASDLVQDTLVRLYVRWPRVREIEHLDAYVRKMLLRSFLTEQRRPWARIRLTATTPDVAAPERANDDRAELIAALRRLPARQRSVLVLRFLCDLPVSEVAGALRCTQGTVKSQTSRGLATMRLLLDEPVASTPRSNHVD